MNFDLNAIGPRDGYKLLTGVVVPRPIAWVTSHDKNGHLNAAPFSFFNMVGANPPLVVLGLAPKDPDSPKDTARNIRETREFVVNLVANELIEEMNICAVDFPAAISEIEAAHLETVPSQKVKVPRLAATRAALECREFSTQLIGDNRIIIGEILSLFIADEFVNLENYHVNSPALGNIGRMGGGGGYTRTTDCFELPRLSFEQWQRSHPHDNP